MNFLEKLDKLMREKGINKSVLSKESGIPYTTIDGMYKKGYKNIKLSTVKKLASYFNTTIDYLMIDEELRIKPHDLNINITDEEMTHIKKYRILDEHGKSVVDSVLKIEHERCIQLIKSEEEPEIATWSICYNEYKVSAGTGVMLDEYERLDRIDVIDTPEARRADYGLMISGDSMEPTYHDGDIVLVKQTNIIDVGEIGIFVVDNEGYIKEFGGDRLISLNDDYDDILLHEYNNIKCCGRVIGIAELPE